MRIRPRRLAEGVRGTTEAFLDGHVSAFAFFGGVPLSILYDNTPGEAVFDSELAVARICGDGTRDRTRAFTGLLSHHLFADRFGRLRIPAMTTMLSGAWRPLDPVDDDQGGARG